MAEQSAGKMAGNVIKKQKAEICLESIKEIARRVTAFFDL